ncbi:hypothetical protein KCU65_g5670, partial [Aureobasidium melanogenum]
MKYTYNIYQWCIYTCCPTQIFLDMDPEALERHSTYFRRLLSFYNTPWYYRSPAKRVKDIYLCPLHHWMQPNALRYVLCAINKAKNGKKIFLELPGDFVMAVEVYQVLVLSGRPLEARELEAVWWCLGNLAPRVYDFALSTRYERERQVWLLGPDFEDPEQHDQEMRIVEEEDETEASGEETLVEMESLMNDTYTASDEVGYTAEDEASDREDEHERLTTYFPLRRRSVPTPYSKLMYDIDTSDFRECADEEPEY